MSVKKNIYDITSVIRSKNSSPYEVTFDIIFNDFEVYEEIRNNGLITRENLAELFSVEVSKISEIIYFDAAMAIKFNMPRRVSISSFGDNDMHSAQQHVPLSRLEVELDL
tara:strand:- start:5542 stop:5871 length:330 start_codon:yes stop_codon:yes gene_type:complete